MQYFQLLIKPNKKLSLQQWSDNIEYIYLDQVCIDENQSGNNINKLVIINNEQEIDIFKYNGKSQIQKINFAFGEKDQNKIKIHNHSNVQIYLFGKIQMKKLNEQLQINELLIELEEEQKIEKIEEEEQIEEKKEKKEKQEKKEKKEKKQQKEKKEKIEQELIEEEQIEEEQIEEKKEQIEEKKEKKEQIEEKKEKKEQIEEKKEKTLKQRQEEYKRNQKKGKNKMEFSFKALDGVKEVTDESVTEFMNRKDLKRYYKQKWREQQGY